MNRSIRIMLLSILVSGSLQVGGVQTYGASKSPKAGAANYSASLQAHQGRYYRWSAPAGWRASETNAGVTLTSPDNRYSAALAMMLRSSGTRSPKDFLAWVFSHVPDYRNARILSVKKLPSQRMSWQTWQLIEAVVSYSDKGLPVTGVWKVGVANYYGMNDALIVGYRAANPDLRPAMAFLPPIADSIVLTNATEANGNNTLIRPKNNPLDNSAIIKAGQYRNKVWDKTSQGQREATMGAEPTYDPQTGRTYNSDFGDYNAARGGYVNPNRPTELLERGWPGNPKK